MRKSILISGVTGGTGSALLDLVRDAGWDAVGIYHQNSARADELSIAWGTAPESLRLVPCDLTSADDVARMLGELGEDYCPDVLVHLVGVPLYLTPVHRTTWEEFRVQIDGVLKPVILLTQPLLRRMLRRASGRIIAASSAAASGTPPPRGFAAYAAAKHALAAYMSSLAFECADRGVAANTVSPGAMDTAMLAHLPEMLREQMRASAGGSWTDPIAVAKTIFWLSSSAGADVTGRDVPVGTGQTPERRRRRGNRR